MKNKYVDLIEQTFEFPNEEFSVEDNELYWYGVPLMDLIKQYGTPLRISYLPSIAKKIQRARRMALLFDATTLVMYMTYNYVVNFVFHWPVAVAWVSEIVYWLSLGIMCYLYFRFGNWRARKI